LSCLRRQSKYTNTSTCNLVCFSVFSCNTCWSWVPHVVQSFSPLLIMQDTPTQRFYVLISAGSNFFLPTVLYCLSNQHLRRNVRAEVFKAVTMKNAVFLDVTPCGSCKNRRFGGSTVSIIRVTYETQVLAKVTRRNIPEDDILHLRRIFTLYTPTRHILVSICSLALQSLAIPATGLPKISNPRTRSARLSRGTALHLGNICL
jgi:hypothetical protein